MKVDKMSISLDAKLAEDVRRAAGRSGKSLSAWLAEAATAKLRAEGLDAWLGEYEEEQGAFTKEELATARAKLGLGDP